MTMPRIPRQLNEPSAARKERQVVNRGQRGRKKMVRVGTALNPKPIVDPRTGVSFRTRAEMMSARRNRVSQILNNFAQLVADSTLGQNPWDQLPSESPIQYARFRHYLMQQKPEAIKGSAKRSVARAAQFAGVTERVLRSVSIKWHWTLRAECWDKEIDRQADEEFREAKRISVRRQARLGSRLQDLAMKGAENMIATGGADLDANSVAKLADVGVKIERLANGDSTANEARQTETRLVWDGPQPKWATHEVDVVAADQVERGPLVRKLEIQREKAPVTFERSTEAKEEEVPVEYVGD